MLTWMLGLFGRLLRIRSVGWLGLGLCTFGQVTAADVGLAGAAAAPDFAKEMELAVQGYGPALYNVGLAHKLGNGTERDIGEAMIWFEKAAAQDHPMASYHLGLIFDGQYGAEFRDESKAFKAFRRSAELDYLPAFYQVAIYYQRGHGSASRKDTRAADWYMKGAKRGHRSSQRKLVYLYMNGVGVRKDDVSALYWCQIAQKGIEPTNVDKKTLEAYWTQLMRSTGERAQREARMKAAQFVPEGPDKSKALKLGKDADGEPIYLDLINLDGKVLRASVLKIEGDQVVVKRESDQKEFTLKVSGLSPPTQRMIGYLRLRFPGE